MNAKKAQLRECWWGVLLVMFVIQFTGAWIYPPNSNGMLSSLQQEKVLGIPFQWGIWCLIMGSFILHVRKQGFLHMLKVLQVFIPFWLAAMVACVFGFAPILSIHNLIIWTMMAVGAAVVGTELKTARATKVLCTVMLLIMIVSAVLALAVPKIGTQLYGFGLVWRGAFIGKNHLGWVAALVMLSSITMMRPGYLRLPAITTVLSVVCIVASGSKGALVAAVVTLFYIFVISRLPRHVTPGFGMFIVSVGVVVVGIFGFVVLPFVLEALGRDATLTGRTGVWQLFFLSMIKTPWFGQGAGAYTSLSPFTAPLANQLASLGIIVTPHNVFLGVLGDTGLFGLVSFVGVQVYLTLILPLMRPSMPNIMCAGIGFFIMAHGLVETHEVITTGPGWFLLILYHALGLQKARHGTSILVPGKEPQQTVFKPAGLGSA